jgi:hypothetical protein
MRGLCPLAAAGSALAVVLAAGCDEDLLNPMAFRQPRARAYEQSRFYDDGLSMRSPPAGTVARQWRPQTVARQTGLESRVGPVGPNGQVIRRYVERIPIPITRELLVVGRGRFDIFCAPCHGLVGDGRSIVARQMALRPPPSLHAFVDRPPGYIFDVATNGFGLMASYAAELDTTERWAVVAYVRALQLSQAGPMEAAPPAERARLEREGRAP